jgi:putative glutathione S-transferase
MGLLIDGNWVDEWYDTSATGGRFVRSEAQFHNWITSDGRAGPTGESGFRAEAGALSPVCLVSLPLGPPHLDFSRP